MPDKLNFLDITNPVEDSLEKDIMRRDLTINSLAANIRTGEIIDLCGGVADLHNKIIRGVRDENFVDDPLRLLRVFVSILYSGFKLINIC